MEFIISPFAKAIGVVLSFLYSFINNYGWSIVILTFLVRMLLLPLYAKQISYQNKMSELQVKVKEIQTQYARDREKMNEKLNDLYTAEGVNSSMGCLPLVAQFPIIIGLFTLLRNPLKYMTNVMMIAAVHEAFFWIPDLSQPDPWILPLLAGLTTYLTTALSTKNADAAMGGSMIAMKFMMPVMIFVFGRSFPAGLALYWAVGNVFTIFQTIVLNRMREKKKFKEEVEEEVIRNRKKEQNKAK